MGEIMAWLEANMPHDIVYTNGAGNFSVWVHRFHQYRKLGAQLAPTSGSMGYGFPAALASKIAQPERPVICFAGDGDFMMTAQELATAVANKLDLVVIVINNGMYGTIRMHQENHYPARVVATDLVNPDFALFAQSFGAHGEVIETTADFPAAMQRAIAFKGPALIELRIDPEAITPRATLSGLRKAALAAKAN